MDFLPPLVNTVPCVPPISPRPRNSAGHRHPVNYARFEINLPSIASTALSGTTTSPNRPLRIIGDAYGESPATDVLFKRSDSSNLFHVMMADAALPDGSDNCQYLHVLATSAVHFDHCKPMTLADIKRAFQINEAIETTTRPKDGWNQVLRDILTTVPGAPCLPTSTEFEAEMRYGSRWNNTHFIHTVLEHAGHANIKVSEVMVEYVLPIDTFIAFVSQPLRGILSQYWNGFELAVTMEALPQAIRSFYQGEGVSDVHLCMRSSVAVSSPSSKA